MAFLKIHDFYFLFPWAFVLLLLIPTGWWIYCRACRNKIRQSALHFSHGALVAKLKRQPAVWKRLLAPMTVSLVALFLVVGLARPTIVTRIPVNSVDIMLVMDISLSMLAEDIKPIRMEAARAAAIRFVESLPPDSRIGLEFFAGDNYILSPPTNRHTEVEALLRALRNEDLKPRTEIGSALQTALRALQPEKDPSKDRQVQKTPEISGRQLTDAGNKPKRVIILMSDGDSHEGYPWEQAARDAVQANVIIHSVGVGSEEGSTIHYQGMDLPVLFDEGTLRRIAEMTGGHYFRAFKASDFRRIYDQIQARTIHYEEREVELSFIASGLCLSLLMIGLVVGLFVL